MVYVAGSNRGVATRRVADGNSVLGTATDMLVFVLGPLPRFPFWSGGFALSRGLRAGFRPCIRRQEDPGALSFVAGVSWAWSLRPLVRRHTS